MCSDCWGNPINPKYQFPSVTDWEDPRAAHHPRKEKKKKKDPRPKGCPENGGKAHIYVIVEVHGWIRRFNYKEGSTRFFPEVKWQKRCVGCGRVHNTYYWWSYQSSPVGRYFNKEDIYAVVHNPKPLW